MAILLNSTYGNDGNIFITKLKCGNVNERWVSCGGK